VKAKGTTREGIKAVPVILWGRSRANPVPGSINNIKKGFFKGLNKEREGNSTA